MLTVILADGQFPQHAIPLEILKSADLVVCCDGAAQNLLKWGKKPGAVVGDLDSLPYNLKQELDEIIYPSDDQEINDLTKAIEWCIEHKIYDVTILGATGLRDDHTLGNISLLADYISRVNVKMMTETGVFTPITNTTLFKSITGQQVSIFAVTPDTEITTHGLKYAVYRRCFTSWWQGTLNEASEDEFTIEFENGKLIIFQNYMPIL